MNNEPDEILCAYCGKPVSVIIGHSMTDVKCKNCGLTNATLLATDIFEIVQHMNSRPIEDALNARIAELETTLSDIRDLARTGLAPDAFCMTQDVWNQYKLDKIAYEASNVLKGS